MAKWDSILGIMYYKLGMHWNCACHTFGIRPNVLSDKSTLLTKCNSWYSMWHTFGTHYCISRNVLFYKTLRFLTDDPRDSCWAWDNLWREATRKHIFGDSNKATRDQRWSRTRGCSKLKPRETPQIHVTALNHDFEKRFKTDSLQRGHNLDKSFFNDPLELARFPWDIIELLGHLLFRLWGLSREDDNHLYKI